MKTFVLGLDVRVVFASRATRFALVFGAITVGSGELLAQTAAKGFAPNPNNPVYSIVTQRDGKILVSGRFTQILGQPRRGVARLNADGTLDPTFNSDEPRFAPIILAVQSDGKILVDPSDSFARLARLNADGTPDTTFRALPITWDSEWISSAVPLEDGRILVGGNYGVGALLVARLNGDGSLDPTFHPDIATDWMGVTSLQRQPDGKILVAGDVYVQGTRRHPGLLRLNPDGTLDESFNHALNHWAYAIALQPDGKIVVSGRFATIAGQSRPNLARLNADGSLDPTFNPPPFAYDFDNESTGFAGLALQSDGKIVICGLFSGVGNETRNRIARLHPDGSLDPSFNPVITGRVTALALRPNQKILVGGDFFSEAGEALQNLEQLNPDGTPDATFVRLGSRLLNFSARGMVLTGGNVLVSGFVITGSGTKRLLLRAVGPGLSEFGVPGVLSNPTMTLRRPAAGSSEEIATNDDWGNPRSGADSAEITAAASAVGAYPLLRDSADAALLVELPPGSYTLTIEGVGGTSGVVAVEIYDTNSGSGDARLANLSTRGFVGEGDNILILGCVVSEAGGRTMLVRAIGPMLSTFGVAGVLANPRFDIFRRDPDGSNSVLATNDDWYSDPSGKTNHAAMKVGAPVFPALPSKDSALLTTLQPGNYTIQASGVGGLTGTALLEIYEVP
jgi:uncharacterized delta-60 repeat protein